MENRRNRMDISSGQSALLLYHFTSSNVLKLYRRRRNVKEKRVLLFREEYFYEIKMQKLGEMKERKKERKGERKRR